MKMMSLLLFCRWAYDDTVTHYIYQGRVGDNSREYKGVKERGVHVVSQYWLQAVCFPLTLILASFMTKLGFSPKCVSFLF